MARLQAVQPDMFDEIHSELLILLDRDRPKDEWRRIFNFGWSEDLEHVGYVMTEGKDLVGFLGMIFSDVEVDGNAERFCNVTSWIAKESHRAESSALVLPLRDLKEYTITNLSCNEIAHRIFSRLGFQPLETHSTIMTSVRTPNVGLGGTRSQVTSDPERVATMLNDQDKKILEDHLPYANHLLAWDYEGYCYLVYTLGRRRRLRTARVHYISDKERFAKDLSAIQLHLLRRHGALLTECDSRLVQGLSLPSSYQSAMPVPRLFLSSRLERDLINNLYSEVVLLNLA